MVGTLVSFSINSKLEKKVKIMLVFELVFVGSCSNSTTKNIGFGLEPLVLATVTKNIGFGLESAFFRLVNHFVAKKKKKNIKNMVGFKPVFRHLTFTDV